MKEVKVCIGTKRFLNDVRMWWAGATRAGSHPLPGPLRPSAQRRSKEHLKQALHELKRLPIPLVGSASSPGGTLEVHETPAKPGAAIEVRVGVIGGDRLEAHLLTENGKRLGEARVGPA